MGVPNKFKRNRIKELRGKLSQAKLGETLGKSDRMIRKYEEGYINKTEEAWAMAAYFGVSIDYLVGKEDYRNIGNKEISEITGLSEKSIEVLRYLNIHGKSGAEGNLCKTLNILQLDTINKLLESAEMYTLPTEGMDPKEEIEDYFCFTIFEYIGKYLGLVKSTIRDQEFVTIDNDALSDGLTVNELYRPVLLKRIEKALDVMKEANNGNTKEN